MPSPITTPRWPSSGAGASAAPKRLCALTLSRSMWSSRELVTDAPRAASKRLTRSQIRPCRSPPRRPFGPLASSDHTFSGARRACRRWLDSPGFPAAGLDAEGVDVAGFAGAKDNVAGTGPVLLAAFEQLAFQQQRRVRAVVGDGEPGDLGAAGEFGDGDVGVGAGADAEAAGAGGPDGEDAERAEPAAGADVELRDLHDDLQFIYRISALIDFSMHGLLL